MIFFVQAGSPQWVEVEGVAVELPFGLKGFVFKQKTAIKERYVCCEYYSGQKLLHAGTSDVLMRGVQLLLMREYEKNILYRKLYGIIRERGLAPHVY